jgi:RNA polymerase sigma-70 factor (ECF subfamily)
MTQQGWQAVQAERLDEADFPDLVRRTRGSLYATLVRVVRDESEAEDLLQETYLRALTRLSSYRGEGSPEAWLRRIALHLALNRLRFRRLRGWWHPAGARNAMAEDAEEALLPDPAPGPDQRAGESERRRRLQTLLARMPARAQAAFALRVLEDRSYAEVAALIGGSEATARSLVSRTLSRLEREIHERGWRDD